MNNSPGLFKKIVRKFKFEQPVPDDVRKHMHAMKKDILAGILKKAGNYSMYYGILLMIFFRAKKMGISISIAQCAVAFWTAIVIVAAGLSAGTYAVAPDPTLRDASGPVNAAEDASDTMEKTKGTAEQGQEINKKSDTPRKPAAVSRKKTARAKKSPAEDKPGTELEKERAKNIPSL